MVPPEKSQTLHWTNREYKNVDYLHEFFQLNVRETYDWACTNDVKVPGQSNTGTGPRKSPPQIQSMPEHAHQKLHAYYVNLILL